MTSKEKEEAEQRFKDAYVKVQCQRFFGSRHGSQYIRVAAPPPPEQVGVNWWQQITEQANKAYEEQTRKQRETIDEGEKDDVSP